MHDLQPIFLGVRFHILGSVPLPALPAQWNALEIRFHRGALAPLLLCLLFLIAYVPLHLCASPFSFP